MNMIDIINKIFGVSDEKIIKQMRKEVKKINELIKDIERNGVLNGIGKPEKLKYRDGYSRRIDQYNRLIYDIVNEIVVIFSCKGHYDE